jgi:competence protein ComEA
VRLSSRRNDADADVIRARLRALLEDRAVGGWVPDADDEDMAPEPGRWVTPAPRAAVGVTAALPNDKEEADPAGLPPGIGRHRAPGRATRWDPGRGGARSLWIAGLVAALLLAGWTWLDRPRVEPAPPDPPGETRSAGTDTPAPSVGAAAETSEVVVVSVVGLVAEPGLVTLPLGARVADAVQAAGGLLPEADPASVNLAAPVMDGAQIAVTAPGAGSGPGGSVGGAAGSGGGGRVDLNTATAAELDALPGIGPVLAQRIVDHRGRNGPFRTVEELDDVPGIGPAIAAELAELAGV